MVAALSTHLPASARWTHPRGGFFAWVELPEGMNTMSLLERAVSEERLAFVPGRAFAVEEGTADRCMRLSFSNVTPDRIDEGIAALGRLVASATDQERSHRRQEGGP